MSICNKEKKGQQQRRHVEKKKKRKEEETGKMDIVLKIPRGSVADRSSTSQDAGCRMRATRWMEQCVRNVAAGEEALDGGVLYLRSIVAVRRGR